MKILFYGQSISSPKWTDRAVAHLKQTYSNVRFEVRNLAIGGFSAKELERTTARDIESFYPDLIVFHVYGDHRAYERIIRDFRSKTTADIIVETDHVVARVEPLCDEGPHFRYSPPPGCDGHFWMKQHAWEEHMSGVVIPQIAKEYGVAVEPRRARWNEYLQSHSLEPSALIADTPHPNAAGWQLAADIFTSWFEGVVASSGTPKVASQVESLVPPTARKPRQYHFVGNRIELLSSAPLYGKLTVTIDGKDPHGLDGCWQNSRVSALAGVPDWPALRQVMVAADYHQADRWTVKVTKLNAAQDRFQFALRSESGGADGSGTAETDFVSPSGKVSIASQDWVLPDGARLFKGVPEGFEASWNRAFVCTDQAPISIESGRNEVRYVAATGLVNGPHDAVITLSSNAPPVAEVRVYRPALTQ